MTGRGAATFGVDLDRVSTAPPMLDRVRRRLSGQYPVDVFGADPLLQDVVARAGDRFASVRVDGAAALPEIGPAALVCTSRFGLGDAVIVRLAVREIRRRRARIVGYPEVPVVAGLARRLGAVRALADDLGAVLRAGHLAVVPLRVATPTVVAGAVGFPVIPVVVTGGVMPWIGTGLGPHRVTVGSPLPLEGLPGDPLAAAELAETARAAAGQMLADLS